jgi:alpha-pyrone synthase
MDDSHALPLAERVAQAALEDASCQSDEIDLIVFVSSTGFVAPGVDAHWIKLFMGCAAALVGLRIASDHVCVSPSRPRSSRGVARAELNECLVGRRSEQHPA